MLRSFVAGSVADRLVESGGQLMEERRLITAVFADLSGFTTLASQLDPEELLEVIDPIIRTLTDIVGAHEGYVEKFAGDALLAFFGAPVSHEDDAERALRVALQMQATMSARVPSALGQRLTLHVGVNSGHVIARVVGGEVRMDYAVLGDAVVLAQRFESMAPAGETYVGETTYRLTKHRFDFEAVGDLTMKGRSEPVSGWRLLGERGILSAREQGRMLGRDAELDVARRTLTNPVGPRVLVVLGEAGVGKSRLLAEISQQVVADGRQWLHAAGTSHRSAVPYRPYAILLRSRLGLNSTDSALEVQQRLEAAMGDLGLAEGVPFLRVLLGLPDVEGGQLDPEVLRHGLQQAVVDWLRRLAQDQPVVLALEDVHAFDASSMELTTMLMGLGEPQFALCLTGRPELAALLEEGPRERLERVTIHLSALHGDSLRDLVADCLGADPSPRLARYVAARTNGNPFFVEEVVRSLQDGEALISVGGQQDLRHGWEEREAPATVEGALSARIDTLPRPAVALLQTVAVIGYDAPVALLEAVAGASQTADGLHRLVDAGLLDYSDHGERVVFRHALVQDVAYARLLRRHRRNLHRKVAAAVESLYGTGEAAVDLLARHHYHGQTAQAVDYLVRAGTRAARLFANEEAIIHLSHAVAASGEDVLLAPQLPELQLALADLHELVGSYPEALRLYEQVRSSTVDVRAWRGAAATLRKQGHTAAALQLLDTALELPDLDEAGQALLWLERGRTLLGAGRYTDAMPSLRSGLDLPSEARVTGHLLLQLTRAELGAGMPEVALGHAVGAHEVLSELQDVRGLTTALRTLGHVYEGLERLDDAADALRQGFELAEHSGIVEEIGACLVNLGLVELKRQRLDAAISADRRAIVEFERIGHRGGLATAYANLAEKLLHAGLPAEALSYCAQAQALGEEISDSLTVADSTLTRAMILLAMGDPAEAAATAEAAAGLFVATGAVPFARRSWELAAQAWAQHGLADRSELAEAHARDLGQPVH